LTHIERGGTCVLTWLTHIERGGTCVCFDVVDPYREGRNVCFDMVDLDREGRNVCVLTEYASICMYHASPIDRHPQWLPHITPHLPVHRPQRYSLLNDLNVNVYSCSGEGFVWSSLSYGGVPLKQVLVIVIEDDMVTVI
jgi:hypothetical protein